MSYNPEDFFVVVEATWDGPDSVYEQHLNTGYLEELVQRPDQHISDPDLAMALLDLIRDDLLLSGTNGQHRISDAGMRIAVRALEQTAARAGYELRIPFRDHTDGRPTGCGMERPAAGRRGASYSSELVDRPYALLVATQDRAMQSSLAEGVSPWGRLGWPERSTSRSQSYVVTSARQPPRRTTEPSATTASISPRR